MKHLLPWLTLKTVPGIGNLLCNRLLSAFGSPEAVLAGSPKVLTRVEGITPRLAGAIKRHATPDWIYGDIEAARQKGFRIITQSDPEYPALLLQIPDPPPVLYIYGHLEGQACAIAVVGSRKATTYGRTVTRRLCEQLAVYGVTVVSGMARGIDTAAHEGALKGGGPTVAVLGAGLERIYPSENLKLFHRIAENGAVITEYPLQAEPEAHHFPMRNRVISGMSLGTVIVEAARRSGSLITARLAAEQNREVFAVPGSIHAATARGTHDLIKQGAKLVENIDDIIEEIVPHMAVQQSPGCPARPKPKLTAAEMQVFEAIGPYPVHIDDLVRQLGLETGQLTAILSKMEIKGVVLQEPGKYFMRDLDYLDSELSQDQS